MRVAKITLYNHSVCYTTYDKVDAIVAAMQHAPHTVFRCGTDVFKASSVSGVEAVDMNDYDLPEHLKNAEHSLPEPKNAGIRKLPTRTVYLSLDGTMLSSQPKSGDFVMATCHYVGYGSDKEFITNKTDVKNWLVCSADEYGKPVVHEAYTYGVSLF